MKNILRVSLLLAASLAAAPAAWALEIGESAPSFSLPGTDGQTYSLEQFKDKKAIAVIFTCNHCPYVQAYEDRIVQLQKDYGEQGLQVITINSNDATALPDDDFEHMKVRAAEKNFNFPYLVDESQETAKAYKAERTPHVYLFDGGFKLRYTGKIDDNWENPDQVKVRYLSDAVQALLKGESPKEAKTFAIGCTIKWKK